MQGYFISPQCNTPYLYTCVTLTILLKVRNNQEGKPLAIPTGTHTESTDCRWHLLHVFHRVYFTVRSIEAHLTWKLYLCSSVINVASPARPYSQSLILTVSGSGFVLH